MKINKTFVSFTGLIDVGKYSLFIDIDDDGAFVDNKDIFNQAQHFSSIVMIGNPFGQKEDVAKIIKQYKTQLYPNENISEDVITKISNSCKFNPRTSISLLEDFVVINDIDKVLKDRNIIKDGLDKIDLKILEVLNQSTRPMGANALAMGVGLGENQYLREYEPFLVEFGYISRIPSRIITNKGKEILKGVKE